MNIELTQAEIRDILANLGYEGTPLYKRLAALVRESSTLRTLYEVGLAQGADERTTERFAKWKSRSDEVYPSEADAREARPDCFKEVCSQWGRAGSLGRDYRLTDGRTVRSRGIWWDVQEPGGSYVCYYFV